MENKLDIAEIFFLRDRWNSENGKLVIKKLFEERMLLDDFEAAARTVRSQFETTDLRGIDFSKKDLSHNFLLFRTDLSYCNFSDAKIKGSFQEASLVECDFRRSEILSGYFASAKLSFSSFENATLNHAQFRDAILDGVSFVNAKIDDVGFVDVDLTTANFDGAEFGRVIFGNTKLLRGNDLYEKILNSASVHNKDKIIWVDG